MTLQNKPQLTLISHKLCPYVQRAVIALEELGIDYKRIDINLEDPPDWFLQVSPLGKVPVLLIDGETVLFESAVIAEYINEIGGGELLSSNPANKARQRAWIEFASATLDNIGTVYNAPGEESYQRGVAQLDAKWQQLESALESLEFFSGDHFSLVDAAFGPVFRYLDLFEKVMDTDFLQNYPQVSHWRQNLQARASIINAVGPDYQTLLAEFVVRRHSFLAKQVQRFLDGRAAA